MVITQKRKSEMRELVDITPGVCGHNSHQRTLEGSEEGSAVIGGKIYCWHGGCPRCVDIKLNEIREIERKKG